MANKVFNMAGGKHSAAAYSAFENAMYGSCVASNSDYVATAGTGMNVSLSAGNGLIDTTLGYARRIQSDAAQTIAVSAASSANPRKDAIVAYIDNSVSPSTSYTDNTNNILKFKSVDGTPAATPSAPSSATIQTSVGAGNPYVVLWYVTVPKNATNLTAATFERACPIANTVETADIADGAITTAKVATNAITNSKIDWSTIDFSTTERVIGKWIDGKTLYQEVIKIANATKDATTDYAHGISNLSFGFIQNLFVYRSDTNTTREINTTDSTSSGSVAQINATNLSYRIPASTWGWPNVTLDLYAIICYTKS